jgi:hypothetical protein
VVVRLALVPDPGVDRLVSHRGEIRLVAVPVTAALRTWEVGWAATLDATA